ncbi:MAG: hypothetical protein JO108_18720 [Acidobacteriaceae bacterium]|nr:hypothetical protein [Acidobacteriaceae bacterium]
MPEITAELIDYRVMHFKTDALHPGLNNTVRSGLKWADLGPGDRLELKQTDTEKLLGEGEVIFVETMPWFEFPGSWLRFNQNTYSTREGLEQAMDRAYGPGWQQQPVTVVFFWVL